MGELICAIHQPNFFPRLSTIAKLYPADVWIHLPAGRATLIRYARLADPAAPARCVPDILRQYYKHGPHAAAIFGLLPQLRSTIASCEWLADVAEHTTAEMLRLVGWPGVIHCSSDLPARSGRSERLADLASAVGATTYLLPLRHRRQPLSGPCALQNQRSSRRDFQTASARLQRHLPGRQSHHRAIRSRRRRTGGARSATRRARFPVARSKSSRPRPWITTTQRATVQAPSRACSSQSPTRSPTATTRPAPSPRSSVSSRWMRKVRSGCGPQASRGTWTTNP